MTSRALKAWFDENNVKWGRPQGWLIRDAEDAELSTKGARRIQKWKRGKHVNAMVGYSLSANADRSLFEAAERWAKSDGWIMRSPD